MTGNHKALFALAAFVFSAAPSHALAQTVLLGSVRSDSTDSPLGHAEVAIPALRLGAYTDSAGHFRMDHIKPGEYDVIVRQFGFAPRVIRMKFEPDETTAQQFQLTASPIILARVKVTARDTARSLYYDNISAFEGRRKHGFGSFITASELQDARERDMTTVLHTIPQVRFYHLASGATVAGSEESGRRCFSQVFLDGVKVMWAFDVNSISPASLRGIEFYPSLNAPSDYSASPGYCGVLIFWTKVRNN
ncbi:MAG: carboxypeptidase-like regulatory domain-containing protein [Gemmatimonadota bacterium]|nr:carboxypeptidase-like regulatory domain-containing protein [Gemmatimonadota bacterium]